MVDFSKGLRILTTLIWVAAAATVVLSFVVANVVDYQYHPITSFNTYNTVLTGSALVLALIILAGLVTLQRVDAASQRVLRSLGEGLGFEAGLPVPASVVQATVEKELRETPNSSQSDWLRRTHEEYEGLQTLRKDIRSLLAAPAGLLAAIFAISAWALPATEVFLNSLSVLNTTLLFFVTYGLVVAIAAFVVVALVLLSTRPSATT